MSGAVQGRGPRWTTDPANITVRIGEHEFVGASADFVIIDDPAPPSDVPNCRCVANWEPTIDEPWREECEAHPSGSITITLLSSSP